MTRENCLALCTTDAEKKVVNASFDITKKMPNVVSKMAKSNDAEEVKKLIAEKLAASEKRAEKKAKKVAEKEIKKKEKEAAKEHKKIIAEVYDILADKDVTVEELAAYEKELEKAEKDEKIKALKKEIEAKQAEIDRLENL